MKQAGPDSPDRCEHCGAKIYPEVGRCWLCYTPMRLIACRGSQFGISFLLITMTMVAVGCMLIRFAPTAGVLLAIPASLALLRSARWAVEQRRRRLPHGLALEAGSVIISMGFMLLALGTICFFIVGTIGLLSMLIRLISHQGVLGAVLAGLLCVVLCFGWLVAYNHFRPRFRRSRYKFPP